LAKDESWSKVSPPQGGEMKQEEVKVLDLLNAALRHINHDPIRAVSEVTQASKILLADPETDGNIHRYAVAVEARVVQTTTMAQRASTILM